MSATLNLTRKAPVVEIRRGTFDVLVDGKRVGSIESDGDTIETPVAPGRHTLQVREGRYSSRELSFQVTHQLPVPRTQDYADLSHVIRRAEVGAQAPSGVAGAPRIERFLSHSNLGAEAAGRPLPGVDRRRRGCRHRLRGRRGRHLGATARPLADPLPLPSSAGYCQLDGHQPRGRPGRQDLAV